jgi:hypothetical protein
MIIPQNLYLLRPQQIEIVLVHNVSVSLFHMDVCLHAAGDNGADSEL